MRGYCRWSYCFRLWPKQSIFTRQSVAENRVPMPTNSILSTIVTLVLYASSRTILSLKPILVASVRHRQNLIVPCLFIIRKGNIVPLFLSGFCAPLLSCDIFSSEALRVSLPFKYFFNHKCLCMPEWSGYACPYGLSICKTGCREYSVRIRCNPSVREFRSAVLLNRSCFYRTLC